MAVRLSHDHAWINTLFRVAVFGFATATYLVGAAALIIGTLLSLVLLAYQWLRYGVWCTCSLADLLARESAPDRPAESEAWIFETPLLIAMPTVGGTLTVAGLAVLFSVGVLRHNGRW
jgi:hypothetical protein